LNGRKQQSNQNADDGDNNQKLNERKTKVSQNFSETKTIEVSIRLTPIAPPPLF
jgi:hypothetical protein